METINLLLPQVAVMLLLIATGFICNKVGILGNETERPLSNLLLMVVIPALIIHSYQRDYNTELATGLLLSFALAIISHLVGISISYICIRRKTKNAEIERFAAIYSNCAFMAIPLISAIFGSDGVFYSITYITIFNILNWTHGASMISESRKFSSMLKIIFSPTIISIAIAMTLFFLQIRLPSIVLTSLDYLGSLSSPLSMIVTGIALSQAGIFKTLATPRAYYVSFLRLLLIPLTTVLLFKLLPIPRTIMLTNIIATACPSAITVILFSSRYNKDSTYASKSVAISTIFSLVTIPVVVWFADFILY